MGLTPEEQAQLNRAIDFDDMLDDRRATPNPSIPVPEMEMK